MSENGFMLFYVNIYYTIDFVILKCKIEKSRKKVEKHGKIDKLELKNDWKAVMEFAK